VGFRGWTRTQASRLGVEGTVRNCEDGSVEVRAAADSATLAEFRRLLDAGPPGAVVTSVERLDAPPPWSGEGFQIIR
jgi:acylphosphatase